MSGKIHLSLLILIGILSNEIFGIFSDDNQENSSILHFRKKRMMEPTLVGQHHDSNQEFIYIVKILFNMRKLCAGVIVSPEHILAPTVCFIPLPNTAGPHAYTVISGVQPPCPIKFHDASDPSSRLINQQLTLVQIEPCIPLINPSLNRQVVLTDAKDLPSYANPSILAWDSRGSLRTITHVIIVAQQECSRFYKRHNRRILKNHLCTAQMHGPNHLNHEDHGSALVIGDTLYGVLVYPGSLAHLNAPDIFVRVNGEYYTWIIQNAGGYCRDHSLQYILSQQQSLNHQSPQQRMSDQEQFLNLGLHQQIMSNQGQSPNDRCSQHHAQSRTVLRPRAANHSHRARTTEEGSTHVATSWVNESRRPGH